MDNNFKNQMLGSFPEKECTNIHCASCGDSDMQVSGITNKGYLKYKCDICGCSTNSDPAYKELCRKIDYKFSEGLY